jgi:preprotein translocase subunit YajC
VDEEMVLKYKKIMLVIIAVVMVFMTIRAAIGANDTLSNKSLNQTLTNVTEENLLSEDNDIVLIQGLNNEELTASISLCNQKGTPVKISSIIYCQVDNKYFRIETLLDRPATVNLFGMKSYDFGSMIYKESPGIGWIIFFIFIIVIIIFIRNQREISRVKKTHMIDREEEERMIIKERRSGGKRLRPDGGYY